MKATAADRIAEHFPMLSRAEITLIIEMVLLTDGEDTPLHHVLRPLFSTAHIDRAITHLREAGYAIMPVGIDKLPSQAQISEPMPYKMQVNVAATVPRHVRGGEASTDKFHMADPSYRRHVARSISSAMLADMRDQLLEGTHTAVEDAWRQWL